jgi:DNA-binding CsgD family transcriptional regulator
MKRMRHTERIGTARPTSDMRHIDLDATWLSPSHIYFICSACPGNEKADDMAIENLASSADLPAKVIFGSPERHTVANYEGELTKIRLREALAREEALRRQMDDLIRQQQGVLSKLFAGRDDAAKRVACLTTREREIMELVLAGHPSKNIAADLGISQRTVETHRASIMKKTGAKSLPALARLALAAAEIVADEPPVQGKSSITVAQRTVRT